MTSVDPLLHRFLDNPADLTEEELDRLVSLLREQPLLAVALREQLLLGDYLSQKLAIDRQDFFAQIQQRIDDFEQGQEEMYDQVAELRAIAEAGIEAPLQAARSRWPAVVLTAALSLLLVGAGVTWFLAGAAPRQVALIEQFSGEVQILRGSQQLAPQMGKAISTGDQVVSTAGSMIEWKYKDGTTVRVVGDGVLNVLADRRTGAKQVRLDQGELVASVTPQQRGPMRFDTPHATATVRGTELRLLVSGGSTQLDVSEGRVELMRHSDGKRIDVAANETGVASPETIVLKLPQWPQDRTRAVFLFTGTGHQGTLIRNPESGNFRETEWELSGEVADGERQTLVFSGGRATAAESGEIVTRLLQASGEFTLEMAVVAESSPAGRGILLQLGPQDAPQIELRQEGMTFWAKIASPIPGEPTELCVGDMVAGKRAHLILTGRNGTLAAYLNGTQTAEKTDVLVETESWSRGPIGLGTLPWHGELVRMAVFAHFMEPQEVQQEYQRFELVHP